MIRPATLFALLVLGTLVVGSYMVAAPHRPVPPYYVASLN